jgi:flavin-dependent dehydrogenase
VNNPSVTDYDVLIIGAGPAGSLAAALLQREGFRLLVVEKQIFPRFVIGESMLPSSMGLLEQAGLLDPIEKQGFMRKYGAVFYRGNQTCNFDFANQSSAGFKYTFQVTRADFDKTLADTVAARGVEILYGHSVTNVSFGSSHTTVTLEEPSSPSPLPVPGVGSSSPSPPPEERAGERRTTDNQRNVTSRFILDCSGYGRVLPRMLKLEEPSSFPPRESLFAHVSGDLRPDGREEGKIWVCIHPGGAWIWIIPFSNGRTSVGVVGDPEFFKKFPEEPEARLQEIVMSDPNAAARLKGMKIVFPPQRIAGYSCAVKTVFGPQFALVGNATEFLDPVFSSGVALALESAQRASQVLTRHLRGETVDWQHEYADYIMQGINTFRSYVSAWYDDKLPQILFAPRRDPEIMKQICSVLAGYVWDKSNLYVTQADRALSLLARISRGQTEAGAAAK